MTIQMHRPVANLTLLFVCWIGVFSGAIFAANEEGDPFKGQKLFRQLGCRECHTVRGEGGGGETKAPELAQIFGKTVQVFGGETVEVNEQYLWESITDPDKRIVKDYPRGKMPARFAQLPETDIASLVAYVAALSDEDLSAKLAADGGSGKPKEIAPVRTPIGAWIVLGLCVAIFGSVSVVSMSRHVSWRWAGLIAAIPAVSVAAGIGVSNLPLTGNSYRQIAISARQFAYDPPVIKVKKGDRVNVTLKSADALHGFYLDGYGIDEEVRPGDTVRFSFVANKAGRFGFRCSHTCGVFHPFMIGSLIVEPNNLLPGALGLCFGVGLAAFVYVAKKRE